MDSPAPVALVTGTSKGLGRFLAERFVKCGYQVVGCSRQPVSWSLEGYRHLRCDVTADGDVKSLLREIGREFGRLDVTINNAGAASLNHALLTPTDTANRLMAVNFLGTFLISRESGKLMQRRRFGRIINITTVAVPKALEGEAIYVASKSAVEALTQVMARELGRFGITVNAIGPGPIETDLIRGVPTDQIRALVDSLAVKRLCRPEDVFNLTEFLARPESEYVTGQVIYLGGP